MSKSVVDVAESKKAKEYHAAITAAFITTNGDIKASARMMGVSREWVRRWCKRLNLDAANFRKAKTPWAVMLAGKKIGEVRAIGQHSASIEAVAKFGIQKNELADLIVKEM